jgi:hypothetical protein
MAAREDVELIVARLRDYWGRRTPWQRRLWNPGSLSMLDEVIEAVSLLQQGQLRSEGVRELAQSVSVQIGRDPGIGVGEVRRATQDALKHVHDNSDSVRRLQYLRAAADDEYLRRWTAHLSAGSGTASQVEFTSRALGAHLLDLGFSPEHLHRWITAVGASAHRSSDLVTAAIELANRPTRVYRVLVPVHAIPRGGQIMPRSWLEPPDARAWLDANAPGSAVRQNGALLYEVSARDPWAAVEQVSDLIQSLSARIEVGLPGNNEFRTASSAFVEGHEREYSTRRPRRQVDVHALSRQGALFDTEHPGLVGRLRSALDLLAPLETGAPGAAVAGGWAAIEALLARPDAANVAAARGMALLVGCSIPRAELTTLAYQHIEESGSELSTRLRAAPSNRDRCVILADALADGSAPPLASASDRAASARMAEILGAPKKTLERVCSYTEMAFRRLYRQRNMVLHAGKTDSVTLLPTLRSAPPLVGASIDRIVHAALQANPISPQELVARAATELQLVGGPGGRHIADLLGA